MITNKETLSPESVEVIRPILDLSLHFINVKGWEGLTLKMNFEIARDLLKQYMRVIISDDLLQDKKFAKKILDLNNKLEKHTETGILYIIWENNKSGNVFVNQTPKIETLNDIDLEKGGWENLNEIIIFSLKGQFSLSLRTAVEAKLLDIIKDNKKFKLLNTPDEIEEKIKLSKHQFRTIEVNTFYNAIKLILDCLNVDVLK